MNKTTEALKLAEEALESCNSGKWGMSFDEIDVERALAAIREAKAELEKQEPVAWAYIDADGSFMDALDRQHGAYQTPLYAAPVSAEAIRAEDYIKAYQQGRKDMKEEAAKVCEEINMYTQHQSKEAYSCAYACAEAIRSIK